MYEAKVFNKVKEISRKVGGNKPPVFLSRMVEELGMNEQTIQYYLDQLRDKGLLKYSDISGQIVELTDVGSKA